ncbi:tetratricopeptide repeat protein [Leptothoe sp. PORK10 BA2]|uniref:tetratricopeptide repeat protein n=1 Tax=Leptothoe sp. PORK10 BA2 TaxID=3110254 RepID=UPI002B20D021|nr:tetratricopeptide repeat protein [Leptothoe sp. PORK10 BA2]MEA5464897.1 tetratricopeptide repeat protein [Leptothoe sp. PORK10 BA2]
MLTADLLQTALVDYHQQVFVLKMETQWSDEAILKVLRSRDLIQTLIDKLAQNPEAKDVDPNAWITLSQDDALVGQWTERLLAIPDLPTWRSSVNPPAHHWWWHPQAPEAKPMLGWLWGGLTIALLTISLAFAKDIATRFFDGAPGLWSSIGAIVPTALALFATGGVLTNVGQTIIDTYLLARVKTPYRPLARCALALGIVLVFFWGHAVGLSWAAQRYHALGDRQYYEHKQLANAHASFQRALRLQPDFPAANHDLAVTYEDLREFDQAKAEYAKAIQAGYLESVNNMARLQILVDKDYDAASVLLKTALDDYENRPESKDVELEYGLRKNLGWAWLKQERFVSAEGELKKAIVLEETIPNPRPDAHCLLAQIFEAQKKTTEAQTQWEDCLRHANRPEDDLWTGMATKALSTEKQFDHQPQGDLKP